MMDTSTLVRLLDRAEALARDEAVRSFLARHDQPVEDFTAAEGRLAAPGAIGGIHALNALKNKYGPDPDLVHAQALRLRRLIRAFEQACGPGPVLLVSAPARIEVCGGHVDYIDYFRNKVLAFGSRECDMLMAARPRDDRLVRGLSLQPGFQPGQFSLDEYPAPASPDAEAWLDYLSRLGCPRPHWMSYVKAAAFYLRHTRPQADLRGMDFALDSTIPVAGGASSSSALVMCSACVLRRFNGLPLEPRELAEAGARAEWFVGTRGGMMDHAAMAFSKANRVVLITARPFQVRSLAAPIHGYEWITFYTVGAEKNEALMAFDNEIAAVSVAILPFLIERLLQADSDLRAAWRRVLDAIESEDPQSLRRCAPTVEALLGRLPESLSLRRIESDFPDLGRLLRARYPALRESFDHDRPIPVRARARYHLGEIRRVLREAAALDIAGRAQVRGDTEEESAYMLLLGELLCETHAGLHNDYGVGTADLEIAAGAARSVRGVLGVRTMGFGMGGNLLVLARSSAAEAAVRAVQAAYYGPRGRDGLREGSINRHTPGPGLAAVDLALSARRRLIDLANNWRHWRACEAEILALALDLLGLDRLEDFVPRRPVRPVILAGGRGARANLDRPKVLAEVKGRPALHWVLGALASVADVQPAVLIVSDHRDHDRLIRQSLDGRFPAEFVVETDPQGTGHAVLEACLRLPLLRAPGATVLVTEGTQAMMQRDTVLKSLLIHEAVAEAAMTMPTASKERPYAYLVRDERGFVCDSRETRLENAEIIDFGEDNVSIYLVRSEDLLPALQDARRRRLDPASGRYSLGQLGFPNEMVKSLRARDRLVLGLCFADVREAQSIKYAEDVRKVEQYLDELGAGRPQPSLSAPPPPASSGTNPS